MMQGIVNRGRGGLVGPAEAEPGHAFMLSSTRSLPVRGQRGGGWSAWEELASLADEDEGSRRRMAVSHLPPAHSMSRQIQPAPGLARTLYNELESSRSENARSLYAPQPRNAWSEQHGLSDASAPRKPVQESGNETQPAGLAGWASQYEPYARTPPDKLNDSELGVSTATWAGSQSHTASMTPTAGHVSFRSIHSIPSQGWSTSPANRAPSPQFHALVQTNQIAMEKGTQDFLSASQGFLREYNRLARLGLAQGNLRIAEENLTQALELLQQGALTSTELAAVTYNLLGCMYRRMGRLNEAVDFLHRSLDILAARRKGGEPLMERDVDLADVHMNMSSAQSALDRHDAALLHVETAIAHLSQRLGLTDGLGMEGSLSSEQDNKDVRMLVIAHYNRAAEMRSLLQHSGSESAFETAMQLADTFLPPGDSLRAMIKKAQRKAGARGQKEGAAPAGAPPGVTPLRLSMLQQKGAPSTQQSDAQHTLAADRGAGEKAKQPATASSIEVTPQLSASSIAPLRTPYSGRSQLTPQGLHHLHAVHRGNFATSARRSAREVGGCGGDEAGKQPRVSFTSTTIQTGLVPVTTEVERRAALPRNVFQRKSLEAHATVEDEHAASADEADAVLGLAQEHDIFSLIRTVPAARVVSVASRYVPQGAGAQGLFDYGRSLSNSISRKKEMCESGTQVEQDLIGAPVTGAADGRDGLGGHLPRLESLPGGWRRENVEHTVEEMVSQRARDEIRGRGSERDKFAPRAGSAEVSSGSHAPARSLDRTYRSHLQRTREAHLRYNTVALVLQLAYRCHLARVVTLELQRNPRHLKAMLAQQIHAFASLLQSNIRCLLAKRQVAKHASRRIMSAEDRWRSRRNRAAYVIQAWFCEVLGSRLLARRYAGPPAAASLLQRAYRAHLARRIAEDKKADKVHAILWECQRLQEACLSTIQRSLRCCMARRRMRAVEAESQDLWRQPGSQFLWQGAASTLSGPQLRIALKQQEWAVVSLQQHMMSCLAHRGWLARAADVLFGVRAEEATRIQCAWRSREARCRAISAIRQHDLQRGRVQIDESASVIQRAMLGAWARRRLMKLHRKALSEVLCAAATDLQRVWCGHVARNSVRHKIQLIELQRENAERHHELALRVQLGMRCCWARRELTDRYWEAKSLQACMSIQCAARGWLARNEFQLHIFEEMQRRKASAALIIQAFRFSHSVARSKSRIRFWRERRETSATILAAVYKAHLVRLDMQALRWENHQFICATALQRVFRAHRARVVASQRIRVVVRNRYQAAALCIQSAIRAKRARVAVQHVGMMNLETHRLRAEAELIRKMRACRTLQARVRSFLACEFVLRPERAGLQRHCARLLARVYRGHIGRRMFVRRRYEREVEAAMTLQEAYRLRMARVLLRRALEHARLASLLSLAERQHAAAAVIQHAYFMHVCRLIRRDRAAEVVSCAIRCSLARSRYSKRLAIATLQASVRRQHRRHLLQVALATDTIAANVRRVFMRNKCRRKLAGRNLTAAALAVLIRQSYASKLASDTISAAAASFFARRRHKQRDTAALLLCTIARRACARQKYRKQHACVRLQSVVRGHMDREWTRASLEHLQQHRHMLTCIVKLQATQRGHAARSAVGAVKELRQRVQASVHMQALLRRAKAAAAYRLWILQILYTRWAIVLQRYWRGALARHLRKQLADLKIRTLAAVQVQRVVRGHKGRQLLEDRITEIEWMRCSVVLQTWFRGILARARVGAIRELNLRIANATIIQAGARGMAGRAIARDKRLRRVMECSAVKIQARARGIAGRERARSRELEVVLERERRVQMAITLQTSYRQHLAKKAYLEAIVQYEALLFFRSYCADILQCSVRCFNARNRLRKRAEAAIQITALGRGWQARRKARKRRMVLAEQSLYVAPHKLRPELYLVPPGLNLTRPPRTSKVRAFRAEVRPGALGRQPSPLSWHERQRQAVLDFQSKPKIKAFFSDLQLREHGRGRALSNAITKAPASVPNIAQSSPDKVPRPASAMAQRPAPVAVVRPQSAMPAMAGRLQPPSSTKNRVPPRFQKVRQGKAGESGAESGGLKKSKTRNQRPRARGSDSERNSDDDEVSRFPPVQVASTPAMQAPAAVPAPMATTVPTQPPRANYNKDDISSDPPSDEQRKKKNRDKEKKRDKSKQEHEASPLKATASLPSATNPTSQANSDPKIEAAFNHCRLGKYREVEAALAEGVPVEARWGPDNNTMLLVCAQNGQKRIAKLLLRNFADMNAQNDKGDTAMHYCYKFNYKELGEYMKSKGADDSIRNSKGQTCYEAKKQ